MKSLPFFTCHFYHLQCSFYYLDLNSNLKCMFGMCQKRNIRTMHQIEAEIYRFYIGFIDMIFLSYLLTVIETPSISSLRLSNMPE